MENPIKMDDLGVPLFSETSLYQHTLWKINMEQKSWRWMEDCKTVIF